MADPGYDEDVVQSGKRETVSTRPTHGHPSRATKLQGRPPPTALRLTAADGQVALPRACKTPSTLIGNERAGEP